MRDARCGVRDAGCGMRGASSPAGVWGYDRNGQDQVLGFLLLGAISDSLSRLAGTLAAPSPFVAAAGYALQDVVAALEGERPREPAWGSADETKTELYDIAD